MYLSFVYRDLSQIPSYNLYNALAEGKLCLQSNQPTNHLPPTIRALDHLCPYLCDLHAGVEEESKSA